MLIVCAILAALVGLTWPAMRGMLAKARLQQAADQLQTTLRKARTQAIGEGAAVVLQYEPGGRRYRVGEWNTLLSASGNGSTEDIPDETLPLADDVEQEVASTEPVVVEHELPIGVRFATDEPANEALESLVEPGEVDNADTLTASEQEPEWDEPIVFRSNGRADDVRIRLVDDRRFSIEIALRGLTGTMTASAPRRVAPTSVDTAALPNDDREVLP